ncbi:LysR family transcriptional regulator [Jannaschia ovalis]|uniref:LysR family transcriptional regulator n=1 Tax=Jannaschia ovalis TaxID=3038773 RepID=A0ABY8L996_9RHOB|nr:LysR family transcriptional regulator [Jannaschia sp. GRR-S6-38]WGH77871.1 LysR family transcriptional regulator [Jannaschia sp. GRR-S6-38]
MTEPNWSDFRIILALDKGGSVTGASRLLGVDASTVSRRLAAAEEVFDAVLIVRGGGAFRFTPEGLAVLKAAEAMETTVSTTTLNVRSMRQAAVGTVRIACVPTAAHVLRPLVGEVTEAHPGLHVDLMSSISGVDLSKGDADIAVRTIPPKDPGLVIAHSFTWGSCLYASADYLARVGRPGAPEDLREHPLVRYNAPLLHARAFGWVEQFADPDRPATRVENSDSARVIIEQGGGIGPLFCAVGDTCPTLVRVFAEPFDQMDSWVLYHESARGSAKVRAVLDALVTFLKTRGPALSGLGAAA